MTRPLAELGGECLFLSRLLAAPPDADLLADACAAGWIDEDAVSRVEEIQVEYTRLFSCPGPDAIPAHQSVYTDALRIEPSALDASGCGMSFPGGELRGYLGGDSCSEAARWYSALGFTPARETKHMPDHVSIQLELFARLVLAEARAGEAGDGEEAQALQELRGRFRERFIGRWSKAFGSRVSTSSVSAFYRRVGRRLLDLP